MKKIIIVFLFILVGLYFCCVGCGGSSSTSASSDTEGAAETETATETISAAAGGTVSFSDGTQVILPAGALSAETQVTLTKPKSLADLDPQFAGYIKIEPSLALNQQATVTFSFDPSKVADVSQVQVVSNSDYNSEVDLGSEKSYFQLITPESIDATEGTVTVKVDHFSVLSFFWEDPAYLVFDLPGKYLKKGDLIYVLTGASSSRYDGAWWPGHVGLYLGTTNDPETKTNDGTTIIESTPQDTSLGQLQDGVQLGTLDNFKTLGASFQHIFIGARRPKNTSLTATQREQIAEYAIGKLGIGYRSIGGGSFLNVSDYSKVSCVGLTELAYAAAGINIVPEISEALLYPIRQFNYTEQVDEITVLAGEKIDFRIWGLVRDGLSYTRDRSRYTITPSTSSDIFTSGAATFLPVLDAYNLEWTPKQSQIGQSVTVDFTLTGTGLDAVAQSLTFVISGSYFPVVNGSQFVFSETQSSSDQSGSDTYTVTQTITAGSSVEVTETIEDSSLTTQVSTSGGYWVQTKSTADGLDIVTFTPYARIIPVDLQEPGMSWGTSFDLIYSEEVADGPLTIGVCETATVDDDYTTLAVAAGTFENVLKITRVQNWDVPDRQETDDEGRTVTIHTGEKTITTTEYRAPGVGVIKLTRVDSETVTVSSGGSSSTQTVTTTYVRELTSYSVPDS